MAPKRKMKKSQPRHQPPPMSQVTYTMARVSQFPRPRPRSAAWPRVLQERVSLTPGTATNFNTGDWFQDKYNTTGFSSVIIRSLSVWAIATATGKEESLLVAPHSPGSISDLGWNAQAFAGQANRSVAVKIIFPPHLSGPYSKSELFAAITSSASEVVLEVDAVFV